MAPYKYSVLDEDASEIRLMILLPGRFKDDIFITMETVILTKGHYPQYEALSYVWGSKENPVDISVKARKPKPSKSYPMLGRRRRRRHNACSHGTISVTQNLATALPYLRKEDKPRVFWIDAICVNQQDRVERGHQVKRMAAVYSMASRVIVWLGPESKNSTLALRAMDQVGSEVRVNWSNHEMTSVATGKVISQDIEDPFDDEALKSVGDLLGRPWFERLWIWQEVRLAREAYVFCGNEGVPWESVRKVMLMLNKVFMPNWITYLVERCFKLSNYSGNGAQVYQTLERVLDNSRSASCSDPRDKVFAVLSLADPGETRGIDADYSKPAEAIFYDLVLHFTSKIKSLDILTHCQMRDDTGGMELPTWIPNWTVPRLCGSIPFSSSCWNAKPRVRYRDGKVLEAMGVHIAIIKSVESLPQPTGPYMSFSGSELEDGIRALIVPKLEYMSLPERQASEISLCRTFCCNAFAEETSPPYADSLSFEVSQKCMHRITDTTRDTALDDSQEIRRFLARVMSSIRGRSFFTTLDGHFGLPPIAAKPGDEVCTLLGCQSPLVLRPCKDGYHKVVGECYIDGFMDGAAFLGPLSGHWQSFMRYFEEYSRGYRAFLNTQTGEFQIEDPRLGPLPAGWYISDHDEKDAYNRYANDETKEKTWFDPRMTPEALTARGVELREFQLV